MRRNGLAPDVEPPDPAVPESPRLSRPTVVRIELEEVEGTAEETEAEEHCKLREIWRSDSEPCQEYGLSLDKLAAFPENEHERWSKEHAKNMEFDQKRAVQRRSERHLAIKHP